MAASPQVKIHYVLPICEQVSLYNDISTTGGIIAGNAAVFRVEVTAPAGWSDFETILNGDDAQSITAIGVRVADGGLIGYFPPDKLVDVMDASANKVTAKFGLVYNSDTSPTKVIIELSIGTNKTDAGGTKNPPAATIGGASVTIPSFTVLPNVRKRISLMIESTCNNNFAHLTEFPCSHGRHRGGIRIQRRLVPGISGRP